MTNPTLITVAVQVARIEERLERQDERENNREERLRAVVRESMREALEPVNKRIEMLEKNASRLAWMSAGASTVVAGVYWIAKAVGLV